MKKIFTKSFFMSFCLLTLCCLLGGNQAKAKEVTFKFSDKTDFSVPHVLGDGDVTMGMTNCSWYDLKDCVRCKTGGELTFTVVSSYKLTGITFKVVSGTLSLLSGGGKFSQPSWTADEDVTSSVVFKNNGTSQFRFETVTVTYESASSSSGQVTPEVTFTEESYDVEYGESLNLTSLVSAKDPETNETVAGTYAFTVTPDDGGFTLTDNTFTAGKSAATYTLAATFTPDAETYAAVADVTATLKVVAPKSNLNPQIYYKPITSLEQLDCNSQFAFAAANPANPEYCFMLNTWTGNDNWIPLKEEVYWGTEETPNRYMVEEYFVSSSSSLAFTLEPTEYEGKPCYFIKQGDKYLMGEYGRVNLGVAKKTDGEYKENATKWSVEFDEDGYALVKSMVNSEECYLVYDGNVGVGYFKDDVADVKQNKFRIKLLSKSYKLTLSDQANGYGTFVVDNPYVMPKGMKGYTVTSATASSLGVEDAYTGGENVPALTPLLVKGVAGTTYYPVWLNAAAIVKAYTGAANLLEYRRDTSSKAKTLKEEAVYYYKLAKNGKGVLGFYWGAENGDAFYMSYQNQTTAYLTVPQGPTPVNGFRLGDAEEDVTAVNGVEAAAAEKVIYNLQGVRMNAVGKLPKGIYVVNGKKMYVK